MLSPELLYQIALTEIKGIGDVNAKSLLAYCGSASAVFKAKKSELEKIPGIGEVNSGIVLKSRDNATIFNRAEKEIKYIEKNNITPLFFTDNSYPQRLKHCHDSPILLFYKGSANLNAERVIAVIGTRNATSYGKSISEKFIAELKDENVLVVSGLAYGIDAYAHKACLNHGLETIGVLAHGLDNLYPSVHTNMARKMEQQGGLLTEFLTETNPDRENFPKRNRIVAGMSDAIVVVESKRSGGALITAEIAHTYNKDVFAFPGPAEEEYSAGCNMLIKRNKASLIENAADLLYAMNWEKTEGNSKPSKQFILPINLSEEESSIVNLLRETKSLHVDELCSRLQFTPGKASGLLLQLEFGNIIKSLPGKIYTLN